MKSNRDFKFSDVGSLRTLRQTGKEIEYTDGSIRVPSEWIEETEPINFGSLNKPQNCDVLRFELKVPNENNLGETLGRIFGGK